MRACQLVSVIAFIVTFAFAEGGSESVDPVAPAVTLVNPTEEELFLVLDTEENRRDHRMSGCEKLYDEVSICPSGCAKYRLWCNVPGRNYAECVDMHYCTRISPGLWVFISFVAISCIVFCAIQLCGSRKNFRAHNDYNRQA